MTVFFSEQSKNLTPKPFSKTHGWFSPSAELEFKKVVIQFQTTSKHWKSSFFGAISCTSLRGLFCYSQWNLQDQKIIPAPQKAAFSPRVLAPRMELEWPNFCRGETTRFFFFAFKETGANNGRGCFWWIEKFIISQPKKDWITFRSRKCCSCCVLMQYTAQNGNNN